MDEETAFMSKYMAKHVKAAEDADKLTKMNYKHFGTTIIWTYKTGRHNWGNFALMPTSVIFGDLKIAEA